MTGVQTCALPISPVLVSTDEKYKISKGNNNFEGVLNLTGKKKGFRTFLSGVGKEQPDQVKVVYTPDKVEFADKNTMIPVTYSIKANMDNDYYFAVDANNGRKDVYHLGMKEVKHDHIPYINYFIIATVNNKKIDLKTDGKK